MAVLIRRRSGNPYEITNLGRSDVRGGRLGVGEVDPLGPVPGAGASLDLDFVGDSAAATSLITFTRSTTGGRFNELGLYETVAIDQPRIDHDPATLGSSADSITLGYGIRTINTDYEYPVGESVVVSYDASNYMIGKVLGSSATSVTLNVVTVVGSGTYSAWTLIVRLGLLVEESRTNRFLNSQNFSSVWSRSNCTVAFNGTAPDGTATLTEVTTSGVSDLIAQSISCTAGSTYTFSGHFKSGTTDSISMLFINVNGTFVTTQVDFNLVTGIATVISGSPVGFGIQSIGNGFYRCWVSQVALVSADGSLRFVSLSTDAVSTYFVWGVQCEVGAFPTSYIPTAGAAVTRAAEDGYTLTSTGNWYRQDGGSVFLGYDLTDGQVSSTAYRFPGTLSTGIFTGDIVLGLYARERLIKGNPTPTVIDPNGSIVGSGADITLNSKVVFTYDESGFVTGCKNGADPRPPVDIGCDMSLTTRINITQSNIYSGHIKSIRYIPRRLTDEELQAITQ